jgi:hypothetical protein
MLELAMLILLGVIVFFLQHAAIWAASSALLEEENKWSDS